jgi:molybdate transport system substrate-binding protein
VRRALACAAILLLGSGACGSGDEGSQEVLVFAAASLTESFSAIEDAFEQTFRTVDVRFSFGASDGLATAINEGAPADVFASASPRWMEAVAGGAGLRGRALVFARNELVVIVPDENPAGLRAFADLARPGVKLVLAAPAVPAGAYAREALAKAGLQAAERNIVSNEQDVKGVVQKVLLGEADAGIVYATDVTPSIRGGVSVIAIPDQTNVIASYPIAVLDRSDEAVAAGAFVGFVLDDGRTILRDAGFLEP